MVRAYDQAIQILGWLPFRGLIFGRGMMHIRRVLTLAIAAATLAGAPVLMAFWFAPVLAAWNRMGAAQSLFYSFFSVWRNWRAFFVYGAALALAGAVFLIALTVAAIVTRGQVQALRFVALMFTVLTLPTVLASFYASYRDIFPDGPSPIEPSTNQPGP